MAQGLLAVPLQHSPLALFDPSMPAGSVQVVSGCRPRWPVQRVRLPLQCHYWFGATLSEGASMLDHFKATCQCVPAQLIHLHVPIEISNN